MKGPLGCVGIREVPTYNLSFHSSCSFLNEMLLSLYFETFSSLKVQNELVELTRETGDVSALKRQEADLAELDWSGCQCKGRRHATREGGWSQTPERKPPEPALCPHRAHL